MKRKIIAMIATLTLIVGVFSGYSSNVEAQTVKKSVTLSLTADLSTLDVSTACAADDMAVVSNIAEGLYRRTSTGVEFAEAKSVKVSKDQKTYTFTLRNGLKWSNGTPVTAYDYEYAWQRLANPKTGSEYSYMLSIAGIKNAANVCFNGAALNTLGVKAKNAQTLVVQLDHAVPYFKTLLASPFFSAISENYVKAKGSQYGLTKDNVLSNGPFIVSNWTVGGKSVALKKNKYYWDAAHVKLNTLNYETIKDSQSGILAYKSGEIDQVGITGDLVNQYKKSKEYHNTLARVLYYVQPNTKVAGLNNKYLRLALAIAFNKSSITNNILKDGSVPANFLVVKTLSSGIEGKTFRDSTKQTFLATNKKLAKTYYEKAKKQLGKSNFTFELLYDDDDTTSQIAQFLQSEIQQTLPGITITLKSQPKKNRMKLQESGDFQLSISKWGADYDDPSTYFDLFTSKASYNYGKWSNAEYDKLDASASNQLLASPKKRFAAYVTAEKLLLNDAAIFPIYQMGSSYLLKSNVVVKKSQDGLFLWNTAYIK